VPPAEQVTLRDGSQVIIRPLTPEDAPLLLAAFARMSAESRYKRFLGPKPRLSPEEVRFLTDVDHRDHEALGALEVGSGEGVGVARYVRLAEQREVAEAAVAVVDDWQGRGVGGALLERLCEAASANGIRRFTATLFASNRAMLHLFEEQGEIRVRREADSTIEVDVELPLESREAIRAALRQAAAGVIAAWLDLGAATLGARLTRRSRPPGGEGPE